MNFNKSSRYFGVVFLFFTVLFIMYIVGDNNAIDYEIKPLTLAEQEWIEENSPLIYGADNNAPPLRFVDPADGQYKGVVIDYVNLLSLKLGVGIEVHPLLWEDAINSLKAGNSDICDMFISKDRAQYFLFTDPIYNLRAVVATYLSDKPISEMKIATQKGDFINEWLIDKYPSIQLTQVNDLSSAMDLLLKNEVDAVAGDEPVLLNQLQKKNVNSEIHILEEPLYENQVVFAVPKNKPELIPILNKCIAYIKQSGQLENIQQKWFGISAPIVKTPDNTERIRQAIMGAGILALILFVMITWNYFLKREVDRRTQELIDSKSDLQITFDGMTEYIALFDNMLKVVTINKSFASILGKPKESLRGMPYKEIFASFKSDHLISMIGESFEGKIAQEQEYLLNNHYYILRTFLLDDVNAKANKLLTILQDITKEKLSEKQILQSNKMEAIGQLAAGMAHEIRNPLGIVRNHSYIIRSKNDGSLIKSLDFIDSAIERASRIIDNLLKFSRLTDDHMNILNLYDIINKALEIGNSLFLERNITPILKCNARLMIYSNAESLHHILLNLISNAVDAIEQDGVIEIQCNKIGENIIIMFKDSGKGMSEIEVENVFNPFYTTKNPDKGTGLGLYIVYNEVKKLGGNIHVQSYTRGNMIFVIQLPYKTAIEKRPV
ncbi:MAG: transporter substrate-binding domain-containing protein [Clostridia bacterium]|nr:transporter substrate-binding domain-containing protein [Clostridia bacterium]